MEKWSQAVLEEARQCRSQGMSDQQIADLLNNRQNVYGYTNSSIWGHLGKRNSDENDGETLAELKKEIKKLHSERAILERALSLAKHRHNYHQHHYSGKYIRFGALGDSHLGSLYENTEFLNKAYDILETEGIESVYHTGDLLDGQKMYKGQEYELHKHGATLQLAYARDKYPRRNGITTYFIDGNHDGSFWKDAGLNTGERIAELRDDMEYLGTDQADIEIANDEGKIILRPVHPAKGTAYALSYHSQKYIESLSGGEKPNIVLMGHYHKMEELFYRNVLLLQTGCMQYQTPYMQRRNIAAMMGFWIVEIMLDGDSVRRFRTEWIPAYK